MGPCPKEERGGNRMARAIELRFADGRGTGVWYCAICREIFNCIIHRGRPASDDHRRMAEECCTGRRIWLHCTGCRKDFKQCVCGRAQKHLCVACGGKLMFREGKKIRWGAGTGEICHACQQNKSLAAKLADARK